MQSVASAMWQGDLMGGQGSVTANSGVLQSAAMSWKARTEGLNQKTTPEELLAAARKQLAYFVEHRPVEA